MYVIGLEIRLTLVSDFAKEMLKEGRRNPSFGEMKEGQIGNVSLMCLSSLEFDRKFSSFDPQ